MTRIESMRRGIKAILAREVGRNVRLEIVSRPIEWRRFVQGLPAIAISFLSQDSIADTELGGRTKLPTVYSFEIRICARLWAATGDRLSDPLGCEDIDELVFDALRENPVCTISAGGDEEQVFIAHGSTGVDFDEETETCMLVQQWKTHELLR